VLFATSRDGVAWDRRRQPYLGTGLHDGLDLHLVSMGPGIVRRGMWLHQYFVGWPYTHGAPTAWDKVPEKRAEWLGKDRGGIYCATQRLDGYVSMDVENDSGVLTTRPLTFKGNRLLLNLYSPATGSARVALLDAEGQALPGFSAEECELIQADSVDFEVRWKGGADVNAHAGQTVRVSVEMRNTKVYAMQFVTR
jgi:hypothetical protein